MNYKRILTIQDISCLGQCSMTVALPVLSACGQETCILPTALLSTHTGGFGKPTVVHVSGALPEIISHWRSNGITFDMVLAGYLGSIDGVHAALQIIKTMLAPGGTTIVDPAMADHGRLYSGLDQDYVWALGELCAEADILLPNLTEAALLTGQPWEDRKDLSYAQNLIRRLPCRAVVLTGVGEEETGFLLKQDDFCRLYTHRKFPGSYSGTGDLFAAALTGGLAWGKSLYDSARIAANFTCRCIECTVAQPAHWYGVKFEPVLPELIQMLLKE